MGLKERAAQAANKIQLARPGKKRPVLVELSLDINELGKQIDELRARKALLRRLTGLGGDPDALVFSRVTLKGFFRGITYTGPRSRAGNEWGNTWLDFNFGSGDEAASYLIERPDLAYRVTDPEFPLVQTIVLRFPDGDWLALTTLRATSGLDLTAMVIRAIFIVLLQRNEEIPNGLDPDEELPGEGTTMRAHLEQLIARYEGDSD